MASRSMPSSTLVSMKTRRFTSLRSWVASVTSFGNFPVDGIRCSPDGIRTDVDGNLWCGSNAGNNVGYSGVTVHSPAGTLLGRIRLPEVCANLTFGGRLRSRLFLCAGTTLYALAVNRRGCERP